MTVGPASGAIRLPAIISDHAVLNRSEKVPIWGWADPGEEISVTLNDQCEKTVTHADGQWKVDFDLQEFHSGPFDLIVEGANRIVVKDIMIGEVWLASGQSNMEWTLGQSLEAKEEADLPPNPLIRQFTVTRKTAMEPAPDCKGEWIVAAPETVGAFSAVAYFFAKEISARRQAPVGLLHASWGGMNIERWISSNGFAKDQALKQRAQELREATLKSLVEVAAYQKTSSAWAVRFARSDLREGQPAEFAAPDVSTEDWKPVQLPGELARAGLPEAGAIWLRRTIHYPKVLTGTQFNIGHPEGFVEAYWNGKRVGQTSQENLPAPVVSFFISEDSIQVGENTLAIRLFQPARGAAILKPSGNTFNLDYGAKPLDGEWFAKVERALPPLSAEAQASCPPVPIPVRPLAVPSGMFHAMIHPLIPYSVRGVLWYQGEANVERAAQYETALKLLIQDWREGWQQPDIPFLICQLANHGKKPATPGESKWAELRDSQLKALSLPNTGLAVLIDVGEAADIHPRSKKVVGHRLALAAQALAYGEKVNFSGPIYSSMRIEGDSVRVHFDHLGGGLVAQPLPAIFKPRSNQPETLPLDPPSPKSSLQGFTICGKDRKWVWADAEVDGDTVIVRSPEITAPIAVRYAWGDNPTCNLYNKAGLPACPFRSDDFPVTSRDAVY